MTRNLYIKQRDESVWERAEELAKELGISLSALVTVAMKRYLERETLTIQKQAVKPGRRPMSKNQRVWGE